MTTATLRIAGLAFVPSLLAPLSAVAQEPTTSPAFSVTSPPEESETSGRGVRDVQGGELRVLRGHHLIAPLLGPSVTLNTSGALSQGFARLRVGESDIFAYQQGVALQAGFGNRVALGLRAGGIAAINSSPDTVLGTAAVGQLDLGVAPKVRILTLEEVGFQLTGAVAIDYARDVVLVPIGVYPTIQASETIEDFVASFELDQILLQTETVRITPSLVGAEGWGPVGAQLSVGPRIAAAGSVPSPGSFEAHVSLAAALQVSFDFMNLGDVVPLALTAEYALDQAFGEASSAPTTHELAGGVWFSGRRDLDLGLAMNAAFNEDFSILGGALAAHYYF